MRKRATMRRCWVAILLACGASACGTKIEPGGSCPQPLAPITYTAQVKPLMDNYCVSCHSTSASNRQGAPMDVNLDTYQGVVKSADQSDQDILSGRMPQNNVGQSTAILTPQQRCIFDGWVTGGLLQ